MRFAHLAAALAAAALVASCSSQAPAPSPEQPTSTSSTAPAPTGHGALAQCLTEHGVPAAPGPVAGPPPGVDQTTWNDAMKACSTLGPGPEN